MRPYFETLEQRNLFSAEIELSLLFAQSSGEESAGFAINGAEAGDQFGRSVSNAGDVNGDGLDDLIIGADRVSTEENDLVGASYVIFGSSLGFSKSMELSSIDGTNGFSIIGIDRHDRSGYAVSSAGDFNGDSIDDLLISAPLATSNENKRAGESYILFGKTDPFAPSWNLAEIDGQNGFVIRGIDSDDISGLAANSAGDVNDDGLDDIILGAFAADPEGRKAAGESYVLFGTQEAFSEFQLADLNGSNGFVIQGILSGDQVGQSVNGAGDFNGDGLDDLIIGADRASPNNNILSGESYLIYGRREEYPAILELSALDGVNGFSIHGIEPGEQAGRSVSGAGDLNSDGYDDVIISGDRATVDGKRIAGKAYIVFGKEDSFPESFDLASLDGSNGFTLLGSSAGDEAGRWVSRAGDVNGDGIDDVILGAREADPNIIQSAGQSYVIFGNRQGFKSSIKLSELNGTNGFAINGISSGDRAGQAVSSAGDLNGDGLDDFVVGAREASPNGRSFAGQSYIIFGRRSWDPNFAFDDSVSVQAEQTLKLDVLKNDGHPLSRIQARNILITQFPTHGELTIGIDREISYIPEPNFFGIDSFSYKYLDSSGNHSNEAVTTINITPSSHPWNNSLNKYDVDENGVLNSIDLLKLIRNLNQYGNRELSLPQNHDSMLFVDINAHNIANPLDMILLIDKLNRISRSASSEDSGEGEPFTTMNILFERSLKSLDFEKLNQRKPIVKNTSHLNIFRSPPPIVFRNENIFLSIHSTSSHAKHYVPRDINELSPAVLSNEQYYETFESSQNRETYESELEITLDLLSSGPILQT